MRRLFAKSSISTKTFAVSAILLICMATLGIQSSLFLSSLRTDLRSLSESNQPKQEAVLAIARGAAEIHADVFRYVAWASAGINPAKLGLLSAQIRQASLKVEANLALLGDRTDLSDIERAAITVAARKWQRYSIAAADTVEITTTDPSLGTVMLGGTDEDYGKVASDLQSISSMVTGRTLSATHELLRQADRHRQIITWGGLAVVLIGIAITFVAARSFVGPIKTVTKAMLAVSVGEGESPSRAEGKDEIAQMLEAISAFRAKLERDNRILAAREQELIIQNMRFDAAISNMSQGLAMFDDEHKLIVSNSRYAEMYGLSAEDLTPGATQRSILERRIALDTFPNMAPEEYIARRVALAVHAKDSDSLVELRDGRVIAITRRTMPDGGWVSTHQDVTDQHRTEQRVVHMATHDALTGLPNRVLLRERMEQGLERVECEGSMAVLCLDLDRFKEVNDTLGHPVGDQLLRAVAERLRLCARKDDTIARLGGDEFALIHVDAHAADDAAALADRVITTLCEPFEIDGQQINVGTSVGIAVAPKDGVLVDQLLKHADMALYSAKLDGRRTYRFFEPQMNARVQIRRNLELELRAALGGGQFELYYQPMVSIATRSLTGFEALIRWNHPERGLVSPGDFIPLAEEVGLINAIGEWVLRAACAEAAKWPAGLRVAVNLSTVQLKHRGLLACVAQALASTGLAPDRLEFEITESVLLHENETTMTTLHQLRSLGVRIAMDDFGTGYSSLSHLRSFPFNKIKIDRSFVKELGISSDCGAIVRAVTGLGASLDMITTAEGVETEAQLAHLEREGCTEAQGYLFGRPCPASELAPLLGQMLVTRAA